MMDVVLIQPRHKLSRDPSPRASLPLGLLSVATPLDVAGYKVRIIDQRIDVDWERSLLAELKTKPICVGITSMTGPQIWWALKASEIVKRNSDVPVVWGGVHASLLPQQTLENHYIDIVVQGEGEETLFELVRALGNRQPLDRVRGIWYKDGGQIKQTPPRPFIDLNQQSPLSYHLIDMQKHVTSYSGRDCLVLETSRGCPFGCAFCYNTSFNRRQWRALTAEQTLFRMRRIIDEYEVRGIVFLDDNFFTSPERAYQILDGMVRRKFNIAWGKGDIRLDLLAGLDDDFLSLMENSDCLSLSIGIESGSQRIADIMNKGIDISQAIPANQRLAKYKMRPRYLFLCGIPDETQADLAESTSLMLRLVDDNPKATLGLQVFVAYPGTELFEISIRHGLPEPQKLEEWIPFSWANRNMNYPWLSPERRQLLKMLSFCCVFVPGDKSLKAFYDISQIVSLVAKLYYPVARKRVQGLHYRFLPELKIAEFLGYKGF